MGWINNPKSIYSQLIKQIFGRHYCKVQINKRNLFKLILYGPFFVICIIFSLCLARYFILNRYCKASLCDGVGLLHTSVIWYFPPCYFFVFFMSYKHLHCQTNAHQFQCSLHTCEIDYLIMGLCVHGRALICKYVVFFVCLFFCHLFTSLTIYDGTEGCVAGLVDWMTSWSFTNPLWQMKQ